ncbi:MULTISPECIES: MlaE family ABC transporter permease [unclassified Paracoccus (in: a-proteobacteria)]|uniref:MlaE family ABC transporter permease n=1 Tax=unclassified Paracoccus (in: a-proteobacteria) TaxID=2688777 RepID=UPI0012B27BAE|nr:MULTISPECIES: ABC transporter permease [unclassified Paracoccus (in: a-proteobacteria)]UXU75618.1 ABC transporter permease [Paracoccus sp. SMMA_5]UXU81523.1 ABC transporter permease [Paracoccus sp. SMMA_5_TC]
MTAPPLDQRLNVALSDGVLRLSGALTVWTLADLPDGASRAAQIDLGGITHMDTAAAWYLDSRARAGAELIDLPAPQARLLEAVRARAPVPEPAPLPERGWRAGLERVGRRVVSGLNYGRELAEYLGRFLAAIARSIRHPRDFRLTSLVWHCHETGLRAVPIVALMSFLIGVVLAFQGAAQLRQFGAEVFVVDLIAISILRELGILLTAIIVAGRTASALTASIGSMKMNEEIDAMRTLGLDPDMVLVLPRVLALVITLPILGLIANIAGLVGGALMSWIELGISPSMFRYRLLSETSVDHVIVGLSKAPVFALIIGIIGCHAGMKVGKDAESLGAQTSRAVVNAIFAVIVADALFSIFFAEVGL